MLIALLFIKENMEHTNIRIANAYKTIKNKISSKLKYQALKKISKNPYYNHKTITYIFNEI